MTNTDDDYYARRERQERERADRAEDKGIRKIHLEMADRYSAMKRDTAPVASVELQA